jgi:hypothetical protein
VIWHHPGTTFTSCLVPLTLMAKSNLRDLDVIDDEGRAISILTTHENATLSGSAIAFLISITEGDEVASAVWPLIWDIASADADTAEVAAGELIMQVNPDVVTATMIRDVARNFILMAVIPPEALNRRRIFKFSYGWEAGRNVSQDSWWTSLRASTGHHSRTLGVELNSLDSARSYHLECAAPAGLLCEELRLPRDETGAEPVDDQLSTIGHAFASYDIDSGSGQAKIRFVLERGGLLARATWSALGVTAIFIALLVLPGTFDSLSKSVDAATALLLFVPAWLIASGARGPENDILARLLAPLRALSYVLALVLIVAGAMLVLGVPENVMTICWLVGMCIGGASFALTSTGQIHLNRKESK